MRAIPKLLSKTKLMRGYRCQKSIYLTIHQPELEAKITPEQQALFDQGNAVGEEARKRFPGGVLVDNKPWDFVGSMKRTKELVDLKTNVIFEAAFSYQGCYARTDILQFNPENQRWKIFEVKSSTKVKDEQIDDAALQAWIFAKSGLLIDKIHIMYLNNQCRYPDLENLFITQEITDKVREIYPTILPKVTEIYQTLQNPVVPAVDIGEYCSEPNECGFKDHCWKEKNIPEFSIFDLPQIRERKWDLYNQGIITLDDPRLTDLNPTQTRIVESFKTKKRFLNQDALRTEISKWTYPLIFLDFETINPAIPRYDGTAPYQQVPFQFSAHILPSAGAELIHKEYLHTDATDPRPQLIPALLDACGTSGSIVAYYSQFEGSRISEMAQWSGATTEHRSALDALVTRLVDPLPLIREHVYDNEFHGSFSLKAVAPALLGKESSYEGMLVADGGAAQRAFEEIISPRTSAARKEALIKASLDYCGKDTLVMVELIKWMLGNS